MNKNYEVYEGQAPLALRFGTALSKVTPQRQRAPRCFEAAFADKTLPNKLKGHHALWGACSP